MGGRDGQRIGIEDSADSLAVGIALADAQTWRVEYTNRAFESWFAASTESNDLADRLPELNRERASKRLDKGRPFPVEAEIRLGARPVSILTTLRHIERGGRQLVLAESVEITKQKEQDHLLNSFSKLADRHKKDLEKANAALEQRSAELQKAYDVIKSQKDRMERELRVARQVQMNMLPRRLTPNRTECTIAGMLKPALEVGGDFFDFFFVDDDRLCFLVGDVSDKGAASGLFMAAAKTLIKANAMRAESTGALASRVNAELAINNDSCMFITLFIAILDLNTGEVVMTNAGHNKPYRRPPGKHAEMLTDRDGPPLGVVEDAEYSESSTTLTRGEMLVVYTDGVTEATDSTGEMFREPRLEGLINADENPTPERVIRRISDAVTQHEFGTPQSDDITVIAIKFHGSPS
ncbi:MAG: serine phosphatase RsbU (regulator of sigma subunit) [Phycisphaerales bacterium]|jgi:serine phosphatase RsbU (regulator of sigma subunit)